MGHISGRLAEIALATFSVASLAHADGKLEGALKVEQSVRANLLPFSPTYVSSKCLVPYPVCKLAFDTVALVTGWEQLVLGGDLKGAQDSLARGLGGPWIIRPENVSGSPLWSLPPPAPLVGYFVTGRSNAGDVRIDPMPAGKQEQQVDGDILPP
jgi:hypothetical protein